ncbi:8.6 kDa transglutaminase substrate-like [Haemaphysalis longicornis]
MKLFVLFFGVTAVTMVMVSADVIPDCSTKKCYPEECPRIRNCRCGTFKDYCGCCRFCRTCPGGVCWISLKDPCAKGTSCVLDNPDRPSIPYGPGHCKPGPRGRYP